MKLSVAPVSTKAETLLPFRTIGAIINLTSPDDCYLTRIASSTWSVIARAGPSWSASSFAAATIALILPFDGQSLARCEPLHKKQPDFFTSPSWFFSQPDLNSFFFLFYQLDDLDLLSFSPSLLPFNFSDWFLSFHPNWSWSPQEQRRLSKLLVDLAHSTSSTPFVPMATTQWVTWINYHSRTYLWYKKKMSWTPWHTPQ